MLNQKGFIPLPFILTALVFFGIIAGGSFYLLKNPRILSPKLNPDTSPMPMATPKSPKLNSIPSSNPSSQPSSANLTNAPLNTKESIDFHFKPYPYKGLTQTPPQDQLATYSDKTLNVSFKYPKSYSIYSLNSDSKYQFAMVFLLKDVTPENEQAIKYEISCTEDNRKNPSGICSESLLSDADINITQADKYPLYDEDKLYDWQVCQKETDIPEKVIYSCRRQVDAGRFGYSYTVYLNPTNKPVVLHLSTLDASKITEVIKSVIDSFTFVK